MPTKFTFNYRYYVITMISDYQQKLNARHNMWYLKSLQILSQKIFFNYNQLTLKISKFRVQIEVYVSFDLMIRT